MHALKCARAHTDTPHICSQSHIYINSPLQSLGQDGLVTLSAGYSITPHRVSQLSAFPHSSPSLFRAVVVSALPSLASVGISLSNQGISNLALASPSSCSLTSTCSLASCSPVPCLCTHPHASSVQVYLSCIFCPGCPHPLYLCLSNLTLPSKPSSGVASSAKLPTQRQAKADIFRQPP